MYWLVVIKCTIYCNTLMSVFSPRIVFMRFIRSGIKALTFPKQLSLPVWLMEGGFIVCVIRNKCLYAI